MSSSTNPVARRHHKKCNSKGKNADKKKDVRKTLALPSTVPLQLQPRPHALLLCGPPGSGKSTIARCIVELDDSYVRVNQDELKNRKKCKHAAKQALTEGKCPIIDRCNFDIQQCCRFVEIAQEMKVPINCVMLTTPKDECIRRARMRTNHETLSPKQAEPVINMIYKDWVTPSQSEGFDGVEHLDGSDDAAVDALVASLVQSHVDA